MSEAKKKAFLKQIKPVLSILKKSVSNKTALLDSARVESNGEVLAFYFNRAFHAKKSLHYFQGQYGAAVPLPDCLRGTAGIVRTDVFQCLNFVESLVKAVK